MATKKTSASQDKKTHIGYNEKNPTQPQGAFKADSMEQKPADVDKREKGPGIKKQYSKR